MLKKVKSRKEGFAFWISKPTLKCQYRKQYGSSESAHQWNMVESFKIDGLREHKSNFKEGKDSFLMKWNESYSLF